MFFLSFLFSFFFLLFFLWQFLSYFLDVFFDSLPSLTHPPPLLQTRGNDHFVLLQTIRSTFPRSWLTKKVQAALWSERLCTDWRFSVTETLAVILNCIWQVKRLKVPSNSVWKENIVFSTKQQQQKTIKIRTNEWEHLKRKDRLEDFPHPLQP